MIDFNCIVQEGFVPEDVRPRLASELARISTTILGGSPDNVRVEFTEIPHGYGFRGGELSRLTSVRGTIPPGCEQEVRVDLMRQIHEMWIEVTGCPDEDVNVSARDRE